MEKFSDKVQEENIREYLLTFVKTYVAASSKIGIPVDEKKLSKLIESATIELFKDENSTATFSVNQLNKWIAVIAENFKSNGVKRNNFLLFHEMTHLCSYNNRNIYQVNNNEGLSRKFNKYEVVRENEDMSGSDVARGLIAIEEVVAQWCAEKCDEVIGGVQREPHKETHSVLGTDITVFTTFADHDTYAPLESYVSKFAMKVGYKTLDDFVKDMISGKADIFDFINKDNVVYIGYLGILCEGIYQENGYEDCGLPESDIPKAIEYLNKHRADIPFGDVPESEDR